MALAVEAGVLVIALAFLTRLPGLGSGPAWTVVLLAALVLGVGYWIFVRG